MPENIHSLIWTVGGGVIVVLLGVIGFFLVGWMKRHDTRADKAADDIAQHDTAIAVMKGTMNDLEKKFDLLMTKLDSHILEEPKYWIENTRQNNEILQRIIVVEQRHIVEDKLRRGEVANA